MAKNGPDLSSPACAAGEADDVYMGFAGKEEIKAFLGELAAADENNRATAMARLRELLPHVRDDVLHAELSAVLRGYEAKT